MNDIFRSCSGQSAKRAFGKGSKNDWSLCLSDRYYRRAPWWRPKTKNGRRISFSTFEDAEKARVRWEARGWPQDLTARGILQWEFDL